MDSNKVNPVRTGGLFGVQPTRRRQREDQPQQAKKPFRVEGQDDAPKPPDTSSSSEELQVSERDEDESGGKLDLTA